MGCLYRLTSPSGKSYIGISTKTVEERFEKHTEHALGKRTNGVLYSALRKYGPESFILKTLVIANDFEYLKELEIKAIVAYGTRYPLGYNMTDGGEGIVGYIYTDEDRAAISAAQKKRFADPEERRKNAERLAKGRETSSKKHAANRIDGLAPWERKRIDARLHIGTLEHSAMISQAIKLAMLREDVKANLKEGARKRAADPEWRRKQIESKSCTYFIIDPQLNTYVIKNLKAFCKEYNLTCSGSKVSGRRGQGKWHTIKLPITEVDFPI